MKTINTQPSTSVNKKVNSREFGSLYDSFMNSKIREYLLEKQVINGWTQQQLADRFGVSKGALNKWIHGLGDPDYKSMKRIADGLKVPLQEVIDAVEGRYKPLTDDERKSIEIVNKYEVKAVALACLSLPPEEKRKLLNELARETHEGITEEKARRDLEK